FFPDIVGDASRCQAHVRPFSELDADIGANTVPQFGFVTPDTCHDGHDAPCSGGAPGGLASANAWLQGNVTTLINYLNSHNGLLLITTDESANTDESGCCSGGFGNGISGLSGAVMGFGGRVGLVALGPGVKSGQTITTSYDHASLLRTLEDFYGISEYLNNAAGANAMSDLFAASTTSPTSTPVATTTPAAAGAGRTLPNTNANAVLGVPPGSWLPVALGVALVAGFGLRDRLAKRGRTG
ncbi:MAG: hypothetical protein QOK05_1342, partial [Chloroflexota bacterium]|nr:hypothetical protein [Chloroflexota bacterium]